MLLTFILLKIYVIYLHITTPTGSMAFTDSFPVEVLKKEFIPLPDINEIELETAKDLYVHITDTDESKSVLLIEKVEEEKLDHIFTSSFEDITYIRYALIFIGFIIA